MSTYTKKYTPIYDTDLIQKWYLEQRLDSDIYMTGEIKTFAGTKIPNGWLLCDGSDVSRNQYKKLFEAIGTEYGSGDGVSTFTLPTYSDSVSVLEYMIIKY